MFQSTHPRRVWLQQQSFVQNSISFNPHTHAGCDLFIISFISERSVSIHTPTQGVTTRLYLNSGTSSFNPHTHAGCDNRIRKTIDFYYVSIHTPTQGVTFLNWLKAIPATFQSTHPRRVWPRSNGTVPWTCSFQSTHPRRVWLDVMDMRFMII